MPDPIEREVLRLTREITKHEEKLADPATPAFMAERLSSQISRKRARLGPLRRALSHP